MLGRRRIQKMVPTVVRDLMMIIRKMILILVNRRTAAITVFPQVIFSLNSFGKFLNFFQAHGTYSNVEKIGRCCVETAELISRNMANYRRCRLAVNRVTRICSARFKAKVQTARLAG